MGPVKVRPDQRRGPGSQLSAEERQVLRTRRRFLRRRRALRWLVWRRILVAVLVLGSVGGLVWLVFFSSVLAVEGAEVEGVELLSPAEVEAVAAVPVGVPLARADLDGVRARVESLAAVDEVEVSRHWPDQVRVQVRERTAVAAVLRDGTWRGFDDEGVLFQDFPERPVDLPEVRMRASTPVEALAEAAAVLDALPPDLLAQVGFVDVRTMDAISLTLARPGAEGAAPAVVTWGSAEQSARKVEVLRVLLEQEARSYDVSAPGRPTLRR